MNSRYKIDRQYYKRCIETAEKIRAFIEDMMTDQELMRHIRKTKGKGVKDLDTDLFGKFNSRLVLFVMQDLCKCYTKMGYNANDKYELAMITYSMAAYLLMPTGSLSTLSNGILPEDIREFEPFQEFGKSLMNSIIRMDIIGNEYSTPYLMMIYYNLLGRGQKEYLQFLYVVSECMASSQGYIPHKAKTFLDTLKSEILSFSEQDESTSQTQSSEEVSTAEERKGLEELDELIGLDNVKSEIKKLSSFVQVQQWRIKEGLKVPVVSYHCVFTGNPGTGKTTVARILAKIFKELGLLKKGHLVETDRSGLVAEYVGQTAIKTNKIIDSALDSVLFIDEAYSLVMEGSGEYGHEAIATLLKRMEDNRDRLVVILAGYGDEMKQFIDSNPGLKSRFNRYFHFEDYSKQELMEIFQLLVKKHEYLIEGEAKNKVSDKVEEAIKNRDKHFGNARYVRNLFEKILENQALRLTAQDLSDRSSLQQILPQDI